MKHRQNRLIIIWITASLTILCACGQNTSKQDSKVDNSINTVNKLTIDTFSTFPPEIDGCSCYFSSDSKDFKKRVYIYMNDYAQISFLKINGILTKFTQTDFKNIDDNTTEAKAVSDDYELIIKVKHGEQSGDETRLQSGLIILTDKKGNKITKTFYGECGC
jgi:catabolite regulation protein CreA